MESTGCVGSPSDGGGIRLAGFDNDCPLGSAGEGPQDCDGYLDGSCDVRLSRLDRLHDSEG